jgi:hypothetical protein
MDFSEISEEVFTSVANSNFNIQKSGMLVPNSKLDESRTSGITDKFGVATLYLRIKEAPLHSSVMLICQSGKIVSTPSSKIKIIHPITKIYFDQNFTVSVKSEFRKRGPDYLQTDIKLNHNITLILEQRENANIDIIRADDINLEIYKYSEVVDIRAYSMMESEEIENRLNNITSTPSVLDSLYELGTTLTRGVQTVKTIQKQQKKVYQTTFNVKLVGLKALISNITIKLDSPGDYMLAFCANGIYTDILKQDSILKVEEEINYIEYGFNLYELAIPIVFYFLILFIASKMVKGYFVFFGILLTAGYALFLYYKTADSTLFYIVMIYTFASIIAIFILWAFLTNLIDVCIKKKDPGYFYVKKTKFYMEYVYQRLNGHPSNYWVRFFIEFLKFTYLMDL